MRVLRRHQAPLAQQIHEAVEIDYSTANIIMNSKGEYNGAHIPHISVEVGDKVKFSEYRGQELAPETQENQETEAIMSRVGSWEQETMRQGCQVGGSAANHRRQKRVKETKVANQPKRARKEMPEVKERAVVIFIIGGQTFSNINPSKPILKTV